MGITQRLIMVERQARKNRLSVYGAANMTQTSRGTAIHVSPSSSSTNTFLVVSQNSTTATTADVSAGYACFAGTFTELSDGTATVTGFSGASGDWYLSAKIDFATSTWSLVKSATAALPTNTDSIQYYVLAKVAVADNVISKITQYWFGGWCIYENRV